MKLFFVIMALVGSVANAKVATLKCSDETSKLTLSNDGGFDPIEGKFQYNKEKGQYGSLMMLGCKIVAFDDNWDFLDCSETTYSVFGPLYQVPKDVFSNGAAKNLNVNAINRAEDTGAVSSVTEFKDCTVTVK